MSANGLVLTPEFLFDFESSMQRITENEFARMTLSDNLWWQKLTKVRQTGKRKEILSWLLSTARIRSEGQGGNKHFETMAAQFKEYVVQNAGEGLELDFNQLKDNDGDGFDIAGEWSSQMGQQMAYWPQSKIAELILAGESGLAYDGLPYFADNSAPHPVNPFRTASGYFANLLTGGSAVASGGKPAYPGALKIDESVTLDVAVANVQKVIAYIASIKMPNGVTPRFLKVRGLFGPPALTNRFQLLTNARFIADASSGGGGGTADIESIIKNWGFGEPIVAPEFATATAADATSWYVITEQVQSTQLGAMVYIDREPFSINYYTGYGGGTGVDAVLAREQKLQYQVRGRNIAGYGHPYALFKIKAA